MGTPIPIPGVNPLMYLEAVDGVDPEGLGAAALFVEAGVEPDIHQSTSAKKAVMNNRKGRSVPVTMKAAVVEAAAEVSAGVTAADSVGVTVVVAEVVEAADVAVVDRPMAKVAPKNKSKFQQQISNKERKESRS